MSDSLIAFQPAIDEPSNIKPSASVIWIDCVDMLGYMLHLTSVVGEAEINVRIRRVL